MSEANEVNLRIWNKLKQPPAIALKTIGAGRLKGMTDVKPQWRVGAVTNQFGPCGIGWKYVVTNMQTIECVNGEVVLFVDVDFYFKENGEWSDPIPGSGGSKLVANESKGAYVSDEAYKMAVTDALSTAMKYIGVASDIYMGMWDGTKYKNKREQVSPEPINGDRVKNHIDLFRRLIDHDTPEETADMIQVAWKGLTNDERIAVQDGLMDKAPESNKMYKSLLKEHLDFKLEK